MIEYRVGDCLVLMKEMKPESVELIIADPPYTFTIASSGGAGNSKVEGWYDLLNTSWFFKEFCDIAFPLLRRDGSMWIFNSWRSLPALMKGVLDSGLHIESLLVWDKEWIGPGGIVGLRPSYETVALIPKDKYQFKNRGKPDIWRHKWSSHKPNHPAEKPVKLVEEIIVNSTNEGDTVLDPFLGSGTTLLACQKTNRNGLGMEINPEYEQVIKNRLNIHTPELESFSDGG